MAKLQLAVGAFGEEVKNLHCRLTASGLEIPASEIERAFFGPATRYAILEWQQKHGLPVTGIVDERTYATLGGACRSDSFTPQSPNPPDASRLVPQSPAPADAPRTPVSRTGPRDIFAREISQTLG